MQSVATSPRSIKAGTVLIREGDRSDQLFLLLDGWACRYKTTRDGNRQIVALLVPGDFANLDALMFGASDYGVRVLSSAAVSTLRCDRVLALADQDRDTARSLTRLAFVENAILRQQNFCLGRHPARNRLAHLLCELSVRLNGNSLEPTIFDMPLTQEQLADTLGLTSVHVNRMMRQLREAGLVTISHRTVTLPDVVRLRSVAGFSAAYLRLD